MSIYLYLYLKKSPTRDSIEQVIFLLGFEPIDEPNKRWYFWFNEKNYESMCGCKLFISEPDLTDPRMPKGTQTVLYAAVHGLRSYEDIEMQNNVIRKLKSVFGGSVYNDGDGKYTYVVNDVPRLSPAEKRCGLVYRRFLINIGRASFVVSDILPDYATREKYIGEFASFDRGLITNNLVAVFLVSTLETFLKDFFIVYIDMHPDLQEKIFDRTSKIDFQTLKELLSKDKPLAEVEADYYNFQNIPSANAAYSTHLQINLIELWRKTKKIGAKFYRIGDIIEELIQLRHNIVHKAYLKPDFDKAEVDRYRKAVESAGKLLAETLEKNGFRIDLDKHL